MTSIDSIMTIKNGFIGVIGKILSSSSTLWGISFESLVEPFFELYKPLTLSKDHLE